MDHAGSKPGPVPEKRLDKHSRAIQNTNSSKLNNQTSKFQLSYCCFFPSCITKKEPLSMHNHSILEMSAVLFPFCMKD